MYAKILVLRFPRTVVHKPLVSNLVKKFDLDFNILNAEVFPRKEGVLVLELSGERKKFQDGVKYLRENGVRVQHTRQMIRRQEERCTHCGACTAVCPTGALHIDRPEMAVRFDQARCSVCELCVTACPTRVMKVRPSNQLFFED
jgi:L-aspartate semialdehyde sulfurtransferase ferredoxin